MRIGVLSLGCSKNQVDTEVMLGNLVALGHQWVDDPEQAEVLIVNTCGFIQSAKEEAIEAILSLAPYKERGARYLIATGCLTERYPQEIFAGFPELDAVLGMGQYLHMGEVLARLERGERVLWTGDKQALIGGESRVLTTPPWTAYVKISEGCDNRCAYCAIPGIRGGFRSRTLEDVLREIHELADRGVKEVVLVSQDTTRFGRDRGRDELAALIRAACGVPGIEWVRPLYLYPDDVTEELLDALEGEKACAYLDIPIQHADDGVLRAMNRRSTRAGLEDMVTRIRARRKPFTLRTTAMVGFPGEDEAAFASLLAFLRDYPFDRVGAFAYSPEEGTPGAEMPGLPSEAVAQARLERLMDQQAGISRSLLGRRVGNLERVLVEEAEGPWRYGRTEREAPEVDGWVRFRGNVQPGAFATVRITAATEHDLQGELQ